MPLEQDDTPHTPGPWHFDGCAQIVEAERPHMRVALLPSDHHEYAASPANGRLIAAAPDMLAALVQLDALMDFDTWMNFDDPSDDWFFEDPSEINRAFKQARAALNRALAKQE